MVLLLAACSGKTEEVTDIDIRSNNYTIEFSFVGEGFTENYKDVFKSAARRWSEVIKGDLTSVTFNQPQANLCGFGESAISGTIDDLLIIAVIKEMDGEGKILGAAFPSILRDSNELTAVGCMVFDEADVKALDNEGSLANVVLHEMGHVLGIGSLWEPLRNFNSRNLLSYETSSSFATCRSAPSFNLRPTFTGSRTTDALRELGLSGETAVEDQYGQGTQCSHWDEGIFSEELMTGFSSRGDMPLSRLTIASLEDLGYTVNYEAADPYSIDNCFDGLCLSQKSEDNQNYEAWELLLPPRATVNEAGQLSFFSFE